MNIAIVRTRLRGTTMMIEHWVISQVSRRRVLGVMASANELGRMVNRGAVRKSIKGRDDRSVRACQARARDEA